MLPSSAAEVLARLAEGDLVLDVGGWAKPFARADWVIDALPYDTRAAYGYTQGGADEERFTEDTWVVRDLCSRDPWPFEDGKFEFAICSQTLEDLRDPVWVCSELARVARRGYIEVPSQAEELTYGVHGAWVGWAHHHWIVDVGPSGIEFVFKTHALHGTQDFGLPPGFCEGLDEQERVQMLWWEGDLPASERLLIGAEAHDSYLRNLVVEQLRARPLRPSQPPAGRRGLRERLRARRHAATAGP